MKKPTAGAIPDSFKVKIAAKKQMERYTIPKIERFKRYLFIIKMIEIHQVHLHKKINNKHDLI